MSVLPGSHKSNFPRGDLIGTSGAADGSSSPPAILSSAVVLSICRHWPAERLEKKEERGEKEAYLQR